MSWCGRFVQVVCVENVVGGPGYVGGCELPCAFLAFASDALAILSKRRGQATSLIWDEVGASAKCPPSDVSR